MPSYPHIEEYHAELTRIIEFGGSDNELSIRPAFQNCLKAYCDNHREKFALVMELRIPSGVVPDGTVKDSLRMAHGYWEAKDAHDDLDAEIESKFNRGYPRDNIIFEDSQDRGVGPKSRRDDAGGHEQPARASPSHPAVP